MDTTAQPSLPPGVTVSNDMGVNSIILASASPRRSELLKILGVAFKVMPAELDEEFLPGETPLDCVSRLAVQKAVAVQSSLPQPGKVAVLAADTMVVVDGVSLGKPRHAEHAAEILHRLSGRTHEVITAVTLASGEHRPTRVSRSEVSFRDLEASEIAAYWATGEPRDKAGAYAIQGLGAAFIREMKGSYSGVMGLPLFETAALLEQAGVPYGLKAAIDDE